MLPGEAGPVRVAPPQERVDCAPQREDGEVGDGRRDGAEGPDERGDVERVRVGEALGREEVEREQREEPEERLENRGERNRNAPLDALNDCLYEIKWAMILLQAVSSNSHLL